MKTRVTGFQLLTCMGIIYLTTGFGRAIDLYHLNPLRILKMLDIYLVFVVRFMRCLSKVINMDTVFLILLYMLYLGAL